MKNRQGGRVKGLILTLGLVCSAWASGPDLERARKLYHLTEFQQSLQLLRAVPDKTAAVFELMGRDYFGQGDFKKATDAFEKAIAMEPSNAE